MAELMPGRRRRYDPLEFDENGHPRKKEPGDYWRDINGGWHCCTPGPGLFGNLTRHEVKEHEDGTITVSPSIRVSGPNIGSWHGYLERGVWREA